MPELPEVETVRRELEPWLSGQTIREARRVEAPPGPKYHGLERARGQRVGDGGGGERAGGCGVDQVGPLGQARQREIGNAAANQTGQQTQPGSGSAQ